jgi:hypothetical protein
MDSSLRTDDVRAGATTRSNLGFLHVMLGLQVALGLLWGVSMLFFAKQIVLNNNSDEHIEKIAMEGAAHFALVFGAILVWRAPRRAESALWMMVFLNALWTLTDLVYIPVLGLNGLDFYAKTIVNAILAIGLFLAGRRSGILTWPPAADSATD